MAFKVIAQFRPGYPQTSSAVQAPMWVDITERIDFQSLQWEQQATDKNTSLRFDIFTFLPLSTTRYDEYASWTGGAAPNDPNDIDTRLNGAIHDTSFFIELTNRAEVKLLDGASVIWGGVISNVDTERIGESHVVQRVEALDYTAILDEIVVRDYNAPNVSESLNELATEAGLTSQVVTGGSSLIAGPYTFRVIAVDGAGDPVTIFTHITQYISPSDVNPASISDTPLRTIQLDWNEVPGASQYLVYGKQGIGTTGLHLQATISSGTETHSISTTLVTNTATSPEQYVQKGSIDIDIISGSSDPENNNYKGIFNAIDPELDPGINNTTYVKPAKVIAGGEPDPDNSYRFSPVLETGVVLTSPFGGKTLKQALKAVSDKTGAIFWVDADKNLHYANKKAQELVENPRFDSSSTNWTLGTNHTIQPSRGPFGFGNALVASTSSSTNESKSDPIEVTANSVYMARVRGWADSNFASDWDCELRYYSDTAGLTQVGNSHKLHRTVAFDGTDEQRWCKTWVIATAHSTAVTARLIAKRKNGASGACAWTDFSLIEITGSYGFSDRPSENEYAIPLRGFETPKAPREASGVANRLLVYGVYKDPTNTNELESVEYNAGLALTKAQGGSLAANTYWVRVVAETPDGDVYVKYATETITDADVAAPTPVRTLSANWAAVPTATQYRVYFGSGRMAMRLKATQAGTSLSITSPASSGASLSGEPDVYYYKTFDFAPGLWESGGKVVEASLNDQLVDSEAKAETRALSFWEEKGIAMRTWEFDHLEEAPEVGTVIPFIWEADDIAEPLVVKGTKGKFLGDRIFWTTTLGSDPSLIKKGVTQIFADIKQASLRLNDVLPPTRPTNLALSAPSASLIQTVDGVTRSTVIAQWDPSPEDDFSNYVVQYGYDSNFANAQVINVAQTPTVRSTSTGQNASVVHSFQAEPGKRLYFRVAAQDRTGNRSDFTDSAVDLPADTTAPDAPTSVQITASLKSIAITWGFGFYDPALPDQNTNNTDFSRFKVYRKQYNAATNPNEPWVKIAETSTNVYIDTSFPNYTNLYQYKVSTVDRTGNESAATQEATPTFRSPNKITGTVDIEDATISSAQISSLTANLITAGTLNISTGMSVISDGTAALPQFEVDKDGVTIRDDSGNIVLQVNGATSTLNADYIDVTNLAASEVTVGSGNSVVRVGNYPSSVSPTFQGIWGGNANPSSAAFTLSTSGAVTASNISATGGTVGGWTIGSTSLSGGDTTIASSGDITVGSGSNIARISSSDPAYRLWLGGTTASTAPFRVTSTGSFTATDANITGTVSTNNITATGGTVGGWTLSSTSLTAGTGGNTVGIATSGGYAFYAGDSTPSLAEFSVTPAGALTATNATVSGSITATSGSIGGWTIGAATISSSSGNVVLNNNGVISAGAASPNQAHMSGNGFWAGAGAADYATAPFRVSTSGGVTATNISVIGGNVSVGDAPVEISYLSRNASGVVTIKTSSAVNATVGQNITIDVTSSPYTTDADFNGSFNVLSITTSSPYTLTYQGATASAISEVSATGFVYTGARISGESASGTWFSVDSGFALKNPANVSQNIITATASDVTINADFIKAGTVTLGNLGSNAISSTNFSVSNTGTVTAAAGTIGGWTLSSTALTSGTGASTVGLATSGGYAIYAGDATAGSAPFSVTPAGALSASSGTVGGWTLSSTALTSGTGASAVGVATSGGYAFYAGDTDPSLAEFRVTPAGALTATNATITGAITATSGSFTGDVTTNNISATAGTVGGWTLTSSGSTRLYAGTTNAFTGLVASSTSSAVAIFAGATSDSGTSASFTVTNAGALSASNATISGSITATSGSIGGWSVDGSRIYNALAISPYIAGLQGSSTSTGIAFFAGATSSTGATSAFSVNNSGAVTASNITATGGTVGGWTLASSRLYSSATSGATTKWYGVVADPVLLGRAFFAGATNSTGDGAVFEVLNDGSVTASNLSITGGPTGGNVINVNSGTFSVTSAGALTATSATVSGSVTATSGSIGGWSIYPDRIYNSGVSKFIGLVDSPADGDVAIFAGATASTGAGATFSVTNSGVLSASGATISGAVTATSGSIGGWSVDSSRIYNALAISPYISGLQGSSTSTGVAFFAGATTSTGTSAAFTVTNSGAVTASNLEVTGGGVGGWKIDTDKIYNALAVSPYISGLYRTSTSTGLAFFAGATTSTGTSATFSVNNLGAVSASNVSITGGPSGGNVINISSGQFSVDSAGYMNAKTGKFSPGSGTASSGQPALLLAGGSLTGDIAYASGQSLNFGVTTATQGVNGAFTEYMRLDASGNLRLYSGYFAIGSSDVFKVDTSGNITITGNIVDAGDTVMQITGGDLIIQHGTAGTTPRLLFRRGDGTYNAGINSDFAGDINFYSGSGTSSYADLYMDQLLPGNAIPMSAISGMTTVSDAVSSGARWHQPAAGARWELKRSSSSQRYKNTIQYPDAEFLNIAKNIRPRFFKRNDETAGRRHLGFIAEEVHAAGLLEAVTYWDDGAGIMIDGIEPTAILATALLRIKDLEDRLEALENA